MRTAKIAALVSFIWTTLCGVLLVGWQVIYWLRSGVWNSYSLASIFRKLDRDQIVTYATASVDKPASRLPEKYAIVDWLLATPAIVPLLVAAALLLGFYIWLNDIERESSR